MPDERAAMLFDTRAVLLERERELSQFDRVLDDATQAKRGGLVIVEGSAGIGKTRVLESARQAADERGMIVLAARASELDRDFPFGVVRQLFEPVLATADEQERSRLLRGAAGFAEPLLLGTSPAGGEASKDQSLTLFHSLYWFTANLAERGPALLVVDDAHWADASSLRFLQFVLPRLRELPALVALGIRSGESAVNRELIDALATDALGHVLRLAPLSAEAVETLIENVLGREPEQPFSQA